MPSTGPVTARDPRFDSLRGLMLVCMTVNHLPSALRAYTDGSIGTFSSAEGFVLVSGLMAGWIYSRHMHAEGRPALRRIAEHRATFIYGWHVLAFMTSFALVQLLAHLFHVRSDTAPALFLTNPPLAVGLGLVLLYQPGLLDILPMYCAFVVVLPYLLEALDDGRQTLVVALSAGLWLASQWAPPIDGAPLYPVNVGVFNLFSWQLLFILGAVIGHAKEADPTPLVPFRPAIAAGAAAIAVFGWGVQHLGWRPPWSDEFFGVMINKPALGGLRLADFASVSYLVAVLGARWPRLLTWPPLAFLGRHALPVVAAQSVVAIVLLEFPALFATPLRDWTTTVAAIASLFAAAGIHQAVRNRSRRMAAAAHPALV